MSLTETKKAASAEQGDFLVEEYSGLDEESDQGESAVKMDGMG